MPGSDTRGRAAPLPTRPDRGTLTRGTLTRATLSLATLALATLATAGCFAYHPASAQDPPAPGQEVRVRYQDPEAAAVTTWQRQEARTTRLEGRVLEWHEDVAVLAVFPPPTATGSMSRVSPHPDTVRVPVAGITSVEIRELDRTKTAAAAVGATALGALVVRALFAWTRGAAPPDTPSP